MKTLSPGRLAVLIVFLLLLSGCATGAPGPIFQGLRALATPSVASSAPGGAAPEPPGLSLEALSTNRILVIGFDGNLSTIDPDGGNRLFLTTDASNDRRYLQPTWAPGGQRIAFTQIDPDNRSFLVTVRADGESRVETNLPFAPFYYSWDPAGARLAYLSNWTRAGQGTIALRLVDYTEEEPQVRTLLRGQPLYFSWSPDGQQLLTHVGNREVNVMDLDGARRVLAQSSANFAAPQWLADGERLVYAVSQDDTQQMIIADRNGNETQPITYFNGAAAFAVSSDERRVAFTDTTTPIGTNAFGPLHVLDLEEGLFRQITDTPVVAFFWSPDGASLLYFTLESLDGRVWLGPHVWNGADVVDLDRFRPTRIFFDQYLRFADQYAQSVRFWSPDSRSVVFSGWKENNETGVWVQAADGRAAATKISDGVYAAWSPR